MSLCRSAALTREGPNPGWLRLRPGPTGEGAAGQDPGLQCTLRAGLTPRLRRVPATETQHAPARSRPLTTSQKQLRRRVTTTAAVRRLRKYVMRRCAGQDRPRRLHLPESSAEDSYNKPGFQQEGLRRGAPEPNPKGRRAGLPKRPWSVGSGPHS